MLPPELSGSLNITVIGGQAAVHANVSIDVVIFTLTDSDNRVSLNSLPAVFRAVGYHISKHIHNKNARSNRSSQ
eukprot:scaffold428645_cov17-Prasinocladus_malaysianus.AAC.1